MLGRVTPEVPFNIPIDVLHPGRFSRDAPFTPKIWTIWRRASVKRAWCSRFWCALCRRIRGNMKLSPGNVAGGRRAWPGGKSSRPSSVTYRIKMRRKWRWWKTCNGVTLSPLEEAEGYARLQNEFSHTPDAWRRLSAKVATMWSICCGF